MIVKERDDCIKKERFDDSTRCSKRIKSTSSKLVILKLFIVLFKKNIVKLDLPLVFPI